MSTENVTPPAAPATPAAAAPATPPATPNTPATPAAPAGNSQDFRTSIPEAYREKPWASAFKSHEDVFKQMDNLQGLLGKQGKLRPADDAAPEAWDAYYAANGRPEAADKYEFEREEGAAFDPAIDTEVKGILHKYGIGAREAKGLVKEYESIIDRVVQDQNAKINAEFTAKAKELFGDKMDEKLKTGQILIDSIVPANLKPLLANLDNNALIVMAALADQIQTKYVGEDRTRLDGNGGAPQGESAEELQTKARALMASPDFQNPMSLNHDKVRAEVDAIYKKVGALKKPKAA